MASGEQEPSLRLRDRPPQFLSGFGPFLNHDLGIRQRLLPSGTISRTTGQLGNFGDERVIVNAPVKKDLRMTSDFVIRSLPLVYTGGSQNELTLPGRVSSENDPPGGLDLGHARFAKDVMIASDTLSESERVQ